MNHFFNNGIEYMKQSEYKIKFQNVSKLIEYVTTKEKNKKTKNNGKSNK